MVNCTMDIPQKLLAEALAVASRANNATLDRMSSDARLQGYDDLGEWALDPEADNDLGDAYADATEAAEYFLESHGYKTEVYYYDDPPMLEVRPRT